MSQVFSPHSYPKLQRLQIKCLCKFKYNSIDSTFWGLDFFFSYFFNKINSVFWKVLTDQVPGRLTRFT